MNYIFILFVFSFVCYGLTEMLVYFSGPFHIFEHFRYLMNKIHPQLGELFSCEACTSTWVAFAVSITNMLAAPTIPFTPFNMFLGETDLWWLIILLDGILGCGITWFLFKIEDYLTAETIVDKDSEITADISKENE